MPDKVSSKVKSARSKELRQIGADLKYNAACNTVGKTLRVLTQKDNSGITDNYFTVKFKEEVEPNLFLDVLITNAYKDGTLKGGDIING